jgi:hypothetical protein
MADPAEPAPGKCPNLIPEEKKYLDGIIASYTIGFVFLLVVISVATYYSPKIDCFIKLVIYCACSGGLGGLVYSIFGYITHHGECDFNIAYFWWYIFRPITRYFLLPGG